METEPTKRVLMVDDERAFLRGISSWLRAQGGIDVLTAVNGVEAVEVLESETVDLVVTDLQMPVMDGFALLAYMSRHHPNIPVMVMTAYAVGPAFDRMTGLGSIICLEKPLIIEDFLARVKELLAVQTRGYLQGISVTSILQLLEMERKTAALTVSSKQGEGTMFFLEGRLIDATTEAAQGNEAAMEIISWDEASIEIDPTRRSPRKTVSSGLGYLIMESLRLKDEGLSPHESIPPDGESDLDPFEDSALDLGPFETPLPQVTEAQRKTIERSLSWLTALEEIGGIAILTPTGEVLVTQSIDGREEFADEAVAFAEVARAAHETALRAGLEGCAEITMGTKKNIIVVQNPEIDGKVYFQVVAAVGWDCDQTALANRFGEVIPEVVKVLAT